MKVTMNHLYFFVYTPNKSSIYIYRIILPNFTAYILKTIPNKIPKNYFDWQYKCCMNE